MLITSRIISWAIAQWYTSVEFAHPVAEWWLLQVRLWYSTKGFLWTIAHIKSIRLHITRYICGQPLLIPNGSVGINKQGLPKGMKPITDLLGTPRGISFVLTLLNISRCLPGTKAPDLSTITDPWEGYIPYQIKEFIPQFIKDNNIPRFVSTFTLSDMPNSNKSGPMGITTQTSVLQAWRALDQMGDDLANLTGGNLGSSVLDFGNGVTKIVERTPILKPLRAWANLSLRRLNLLSLIFKGKSTHLVTYLRKLSIVNDPEGKARIICIFDYWSQLALKGIHLWAFDVLRSIPSDRTFDQNPFMIKKEGPFYSIDLTAATDRFPLELQALLLEALSSKAVADSWKRILTAHEVYVPWRGRSVFYAAGQPMGAYSSWAVFALTHHLVVQYSAKSVGFNNFRDYMLLGDDIVIANKAVAEKYMSTLSELGVGISEHKTHVSNDTYEFAKRWIHKGIEVSGIPLRGLMSSNGKYYLLAPMMIHLINTLPPSVFQTVPDLVESFFIYTGHYKRHARSMYNRTREFIAVWKYIASDNYDLILDLIKEKDKNWHPFPAPYSKDAKEYLDWLLERTVHVEISRVNWNLKTFLNGMHERFHKLILGACAGQHDNISDEITSLLPYHPIWQSHMAELSRVQERTSILMEEHRWRELLEVITIPDPNKIVFSRNDKDVTQGVAKFAKNLFKTAAMQRDKDIWFLAQFD